MTFLEYTLSIVLVMMYVACIFTVAILTFRKGRYVLGILGVVLPFLWLIGAVLPPRRGSPQWYRDEPGQLVGDAAEANARSSRSSTSAGNVV